MKSISTRVLLLLGYALLLIVGTSAAINCTLLEQDCWTRCGEIHTEAVALNCANGGYSGCALDVLGCGRYSCSVYNSYWCEKPGYVECVVSKVTQYQSCLESCNAKYRARTSYGEGLFILSTCASSNCTAYPQGCNCVFDTGILNCKNNSCFAHCAGLSGADGGRWVRYSWEQRQWDACECFEVLTDEDCTAYCLGYHGTDKIHGPEAYGKMENNVCTCHCQEGYVPDQTLTCVKATVKETTQATPTTEIPNHPPTVTLGCVPRNPITADMIICTAKASDKDGDTLRFEWFKDTGAGFRNLDPSDPGELVWDFDLKPGTYTLRVVVSDGKGGEGDATTTIDIKLPYAVVEIIGGGVTIDGRPYKEGETFIVHEGTETRDYVETSYYLDPGYAVVKFRDGPVIQIKPGTSLQFVGKSIFVYDGNVWHEWKIGKEGREFECVNWAYGRGCVKGTLFEFHVKNNETAVIRVFEGVVEASNTAKTWSVDVGEGKSITIYRDRQPSPPIPFDPRRIDPWWERPPFIPQHEYRGLIFESRQRPPGGTVQIPLTLQGVTERIGNLDLELHYDPSILRATGLNYGGLTGDALMDSNLENGRIRIGIASKEGFEGEGSVAEISFEVIGSESTASPLTIANLLANQATDLFPLPIPIHNGVFTVISEEEGRADASGDLIISALDALIALQMSVGKRPVELTLDMNGDGKVTSLDARTILEMAVQ